MSLISTLEKKLKKTKKRKSLTILVILLIIIMLSSYAYIKNHCALDYKNLIVKYSEIYRFQPYFVAAMIKTESDFNPNIISRKEAIGLMQITPETSNWISSKLGEILEKDAIKDPETNIRYGLWYLRFLMDKYDDNENLAIAAYNAGTGNVDEWLNEGTINDENLDINHIPFNETRNYLYKIKIYELIYQYLYDWKK